MWIIKQTLAFLIGIAGGVTTAAGVFALITVIGMIPRIAGATRTGHCMHIYETAIVFGGGLGSFVDIYKIQLFGGMPGLFLFGICSGIYVGCLVMSLAETLDVFPIIVRRCRLSVGFCAIVISLALGKMIGAFLIYGLRLFS